MGGNGSGGRPHPSLASGSTVRALLRAHRYNVPAAARAIGRTKSAVYMAMQTHGVVIPQRQAQRILRAQRRTAAQARWGKK